MHRQLYEICTCFATQVMNHRDSQLGHINLTTSIAALRPGRIPFKKEVRIIGLGQLTLHEWVYD